MNFVKHTSTGDQINVIKNLFCEAKIKGNFFLIYVAFQSTPQTLQNRQDRYTLHHKSHHTCHVNMLQINLITSLIQSKFAVQNDIGSLLYFK